MTIDKQKLLDAEDALLSRVDGHLASRIMNRTSRGFNWASDLGFECDTYQALCRLKGELRPPNSLRLEKVFRRGREWEIPNVRLLQDAGIRVADRIGSYHWKEYQIKGRLDFWVYLKLDGREVKIPAEHKTCSPNVFRAVLKHKERGEPLTKAKYVWLRKYPGQLQTYELQMGSEFGLWFFFEAVSGDYFFWLYPLDYQYAESLIQRAERCNSNIAKGIIPEPKRKDICLGCDFCETYCFVGKDFGPGYELVDDEDLLAKVGRYFETMEAHDEHMELDLELLGNKKKPGLFYGRNVVTTDYKVTSKEVESSFWKVNKPKEEHSEKITYKYWKTTIEKLKEGEGE